MSLRDISILYAYTLIISIDKIKCSCIIKYFTFMYAWHFLKDKLLHTHMKKKGWGKKMEGREKQVIFCILVLHKSCENILFLMYIFA